MSRKLLLFDGLQGCFRTIKLRGRKPTCVVCGDDPTIKKLIDYEQFCGSKATDKTLTVNLLTAEDRITVQEYQQHVSNELPHVLVDVRPEVQTEICKLPNTLNIPIDAINSNDAKDKVTSAVKQIMTPSKPAAVFVICRQGNDSQVVTQKLQEMLSDMPAVVKDIKGGLLAWSNHVNPSFPKY